MPFQKVQEFQLAVLNRPLEEKRLLTEDELLLLARQLREESKELEDAHVAGDYIGAIDALIDNLYFTIGGLHRLGLTPEQMLKCFDVVHHCNMEKKRGRVEREGVSSGDDAVKPAEWVGPEERIAEILGGAL
jgi:predicted HAD superfamily Cof-like phosphohydrolase